MAKVDLSQNKYAEFFKRLASDDEFRSIVEDDPKAALSVYGIDLDPAVVFKTQVNLPSKKDLEKNLGAHIERMASLDMEMVFVR